MSAYVDKQREEKKRKKLSQDIHLFSAKANFGSWHTLGEAVCNHVPSRNEVRTKHTMLYLVPEPVEVKIKVFHATMMFRILGHSDRTLVVHLEGGRFLNTISKF